MSEVFDRDNNGLVSVIMPIYNIRDYLSDAFESLVDQTYRNFEVIMVDDGSCDGSASLCERMAEKDSRFIYCKKNNGGLSSARNFGLKRSAGSYVMFLDGDDMLAPNAIEHLLGLMLAHDVKLVTCAFKKVACAKDKVDWGGDEERISIVTGEQLFEMMLRLDGETGSATAKLYDRSLCPHLLFPEGRMFEDFGVEAKLFALLDKAVVSNAALYGYVAREGSITSETAYSPRHMDDIKASLDLVREVVEEREGFEELYRCFEATCYVRVVSRLSKDECPNEKYFADCVKKAKRAAGDAAFSRRIGNVWRVRCALFWVSRSVHNALYKLYGRLTGKVIA